MPLMAGSIFLVLSLMAETISIPAKEELLEEPEAPGLREPRNPEEEDVADFGRRWVKDALGLVNRGDGHGRSPVSKNLGDGELRSLWPLPSFSSWPHGGPDEPVCQVKLERRDLQSPHLLQVVGLLNSYNSGFLKAVSSSSWSTGELEIFGMCPTDAPHGLLSSLQHAGDSLAIPEENRFLLLHLEEVKWEPAATKLRFELAIRTATANAFSLSHLALLVFYRGEEISGAAGPWQKFLVSGEGLPQTQVDAPFQVVFLDCKPHRPQLALVDDGTCSLHLSQREDRTFVYCKDQDVASEGTYLAHKRIIPIILERQSWKGPCVDPSAERL